MIAGLNIINTKMYTHFIEQFKNKGKLLQGPMCEIKDLKRNLGITKSSADLVTIAVWKIKFKQPTAQAPDTLEI